MEKTSLYGNRGLIRIGGRGQGCAQQHRRETVGKEKKGFHPPKNRSATPLLKSKSLGHLASEREISLWDLEIRLAHAHPWPRPPGADNHFPCFFNVSSVTYVP
jgi:hypothetical protein